MYVYYTCWKIRKNSDATFIHSNTSLLCFIFLVVVISFKIFNTLDSLLKISGKKYSLALHWVEMDMDTDPDLARQALDNDPDSDTPKICRSDRIRIHTIPVSLFF
jgi:hypothetical protein